MKIPESSKPSLKLVGSLRRQHISVSTEQLIKVAPLISDKSLPLLIQPTIDGVNLVSWARSNRDLITTHLHKHGGILLRSFQVNGVAEFEQFIEVVAGNSLEYCDRSSPRSLVQGNIYTSTDYPASQSIFLHSENSYATTWPLKLFFFCITPALQGGETPIADTRKVFNCIAPDIRERFFREQVMYVRNFGDGFGLPWQTVFQTTEKAVVEAFCRTNNIEFEWKAGDRLRTRQIRSTIAKHPGTGELVWFNHAAFFHVSTLEPTIRSALLADLGEENLPHNTYYGDGSPIEAVVLDEIRQSYIQETTIFPWITGDVLILDNMLTAHGRMPFIGSRKVLVGMAEPFSN